MNQPKIEKLDERSVLVIDCPILHGVGITHKGKIITITCRSLADTEPLFQNVQINKDIYSKDREGAAAKVAHGLIMTGIGNMIPADTPRQEKTDLVFAKHEELNGEAAETALASALVTAIDEHVGAKQ